MIIWEFESINCKGLKTKIHNLQNISGKDNDFKKGIRNFKIWPIILKAENNQNYLGRVDARVRNW